MLHYYLYAFFVFVQPIFSKFEKKDSSKSYETIYDKKKETKEKKVKTYKTSYDKFRNYNALKELWIWIAEKDADDDLAQSKKYPSGAFIARSKNKGPSKSIDNEISK